MKTANRLFKDLWVGSDYSAPEAFLKKYATHRLTPNVSNWPVEILKVLGEDYAWVTAGVRPATVDIEEVDKDHGSAYGGIIVYSGAGGENGAGASRNIKAAPVGPTIIIPFVVKDFMMSPLDVFISAKKVLPLTPKRIQDELLATQIFSGVDRSKNHSMSSLQGELQPPPEAFYGQFGRPYGEGKMGSARKTAGAISTQDSLILNQLLSTVSASEMKTFKDTVYSNPATLAQFTKNQNVDILQRVVKGRPLTNDDFKNVARFAFPKNVLLFEKKSPGWWDVTMYNDHYAAPDRMTCSETDLLEQFADLKAVAEKIWSTDGFLLTVNHKEVEPVVWNETMKPDTTPVHSTGVYMVVSENKQIEKGFCWNGFRDYNGNALDYKLWYDGDCWTVQDVLQGEKIEGADWTHEEGFLKPGIWGTFLVTDESGEQAPMMPFKIVAVYKVGEKVAIRASDMFGHDVNFILDPGVEKWANATGALSDSLADHLEARAFFVPKGTQFVTLGSQRVPMIQTARELLNAFRDTAMATFSNFRDKGTPSSSLAVSCTDRKEAHKGAEHDYRLEGRILDAICRTNVIDASRLKAKWALVMTGCSVEKADEILDMACQKGRTIVMGLRPMKADSNLRIDPKTDEIIKISAVLRKNLIKEAAYIKDKTSVDALLSLNFVTPENLIVFLRNIDKFKDVETSLAKLLLMVRFGLEAVPEMAVANALKNLNMVNESLEMLKGVLGNRMSPDGEVFADEEIPVSADTKLQE